MVETTAAQSVGTSVDPDRLAVLSNRFELIILETSSTAMTASRSSVIKNARDMSRGILTPDRRLVSVEEALPIHGSALERTTRPNTGPFDDIEDGDAFLNNSPFHRATRHADTIHRWGVHVRCVRIQENGRDQVAILWIGFEKTRVGNVGYGDCRAQVGACRAGAWRIRELVKAYGKDMIKAFVEACVDGGERRAIAAIRQMPAGTFIREVRHGPVAARRRSSMSLKGTGYRAPAPRARTGWTSPRVRPRRARRAGLGLLDKACVPAVSLPPGEGARVVAHGNLLVGALG